MQDWRSNFRWVTRIFPGDDHYRLLFRKIPTLIEKSIQEIDSRGWRDGPNEVPVRLITTGHSLGGGLAQLFAYSVQHSAIKPNQIASIVFNSTVVTGYEQFPSADQVSCTVPIWRIEETGDVLDSVRQFFKNFYDWTENICKVEFNYSQSWNPIRSHSMSNLALGLNRSAKIKEPHKGHELKGLFKDTVDCTCLYRKKNWSVEQIKARYPNVCSHISEIPWEGKECRADVRGGSMALNSFIPKDN